MPQKIYNLRLHRWTVVTVGCGGLLIAGLMFFAGALVGHWWAERPETTVATDDAIHGTVPPTTTETGSGATLADGSTTALPPTADGQPVAGNGGRAGPGAAPAGGGSTAALGRAVAPPVSGPRVTGPGVTGPQVSGPRISRSGISGPRVTQPTVRAPTATGPRVGSPRRPSTATVAGLAGGGTGAGSAAVPEAGSQPMVDGATGELLVSDDTQPAPRLFAVQVGLFADTEEALAEIEALSGLGYAPYLVVVRAEERRTVVRSVRLGPYPDRRTAQEAAANFRLDENRGAAVVREHEPPAAP